MASTIRENSASHSESVLYKDRKAAVAAALVEKVVGECGLDLKGKLDCKKCDFLVHCSCLAVLFARQPLLANGHVQLLS